MYCTLIKIFPTILFSFLSAFLPLSISFLLHYNILILILLEFPFSPYPAPFLLNFIYL
ncbi:hypothetical protein L873DRAFT_16418 [Choiromyces venosus 120613-1]|uniref:Uncharacterized protein n=1 Tax=Choiromyces venosus 120613-1 TaxID=1336337 RepID=A0A3N4K9R5_9PEZI|nr:hypothetical protein L873DRAFT_16418 [Choiromyces venosus 120613-1]